MTAPVWTPSRLGESWRLDLHPVLRLEVVRETQSRDNPSPTPYAVTVCGARLKKRYATESAAKEAAVNAGRRFLREAVASLTAFLGGEVP